MLLVIVGAGASYDSIPSRTPAQGREYQYRPPLADQLFEPREFFEDFQRLIPQVMQIAPRLMHRPTGESVEDVLERYAGEVGVYPHRATQLAAVRFYIQAIISRSEDGWYRNSPIPTNLMSLIDQIERARGERERPIFVTFNYDRLIEHALENRNQKFDGLLDYVRPDRIQLYKLHGSVDWMRRIERMDRSRFNAPDGWAVARQICDEIRTFPPPGIIERAKGVPSSAADGYLALPAIAIPVKEKSEFECPPEHRASLVSAIKDVTTVLTIGWRGAEQHLLKLLRESGLRSVDGVCIGGSPADADATILSLKKGGITGEFHGYGAGFTNFASSREMDRLLNLTWR